MKNLIGLTIAACAVGAASYAVYRMLNKKNKCNDDDLSSDNDLLFDDDYIPDDNDYWDSLKDDYSDGTADYIRPHDCRDALEKYCSESVQKSDDTEMKETSENEISEKEILKEEISVEEILVDKIPIVDKIPKKSNKRKKKSVDDEFNLTGEDNE